ncbi:hypothetical protein ACFWP4_03710, partial [Streptomyces sp. NPDC058486]
WRLRCPTTPTRFSSLAVTKPPAGGGSRPGFSQSYSPAQLLAHISRRWLHVRDTYAVDVVREDADAALLIAVAVCVIRMAERED